MITESEPLGAAGEACASCGSALAEDQRYCLTCGTRRSGPRVELPAEVAPRALPAAPPARWDRFGGVWGVAALLLVALAAGVVIGRSGNKAPPAAAAPIVKIAAAPVAAAPAAATGPTGTTSIVAPVQQTAAADEWPTGQAGYTVELMTLPKATTAQAAADAAKTSATTLGAKDVGVLDGDAHDLDTGQLIVYSGVDKSRAEAEKAIQGLMAKFPQAKVVKVAAAGAAPAAPSSSSSSSSANTGTESKQALAQKQSLSTSDFQKQSKKLPKTTVLPGKPPAKDDKAPGGGSAAETIG